MQSTYDWLLRVLRALWRTATARWRKNAPAPATDPVPAPLNAEPAAMDPEPVPLDPKIAAEIEAIKRDLAQKAVQREALEVRIAEHQKQIAHYEHLQAIERILNSYQFTSVDARRAARHLIELHATPGRDIESVAKELLAQHTFLLAPVNTGGSGARPWPVTIPSLGPRG